MDKGTSINRIPFFLVTGFLGSGKTTLLKNILETHSNTYKIAVVQNEYGDGNVDGTELRNTGNSFEILEMNRGSVFCVCLLSDFKTALMDMIDTCKPDVVILEATGLADPIAVGQLLQAEELQNRLFLAHVWCIVDSSNFLEMEHVVTRMTHQVRIADTVVLNKSDLTSENGITLVEQRIKELNPYADVVQSQHCQMDITSIFSVLTKQPAAYRNNGSLEQYSEGRPQITSVVLKSPTIIPHEQLIRFLNQFEKTTYRIKGYVNTSKDTTVSIQSSFGESHITPVEKFFGQSEIIALGPDIDPANFQQAFEAFAHT